MKKFSFLYNIQYQKTFVETTKNKSKSDPHFFLAKLLFLVLYSFTDDSNPAYLFWLLPRFEGWINRSAEILSSSMIRKFALGIKVFRANIAMQRNWSVSLGLIWMWPRNTCRVGNIGIFFGIFFFEKYSIFE
jgi:hypothetical protein